MSEYFSAFIWVAAFVVPVLLFPAIASKSRRLGGLAVGLYVVSYLPFTISGSYVTSNHGGSEWTRAWIPRHLMVEYTGQSGRTKTDITTLGGLYWPCILIDRLIWHRGLRADV